MTNMEWFNIISGIAGVCGALSWIPIVMDKIKKRELRATLIHCRFFDKFYIPLLPPDFINQLTKDPNKQFEKYKGTLIVIGINICSVNKDFVVEKVYSKLIMDKSQHEAILISPDVIVNYVPSQDQVNSARLMIPSDLDITKMKNLKANTNTRLYMAFVCKDVEELLYENFKQLCIKLIDLEGKEFEFIIDKDKIDNASLICDKDIYDVDYSAKICNRKLIEFFSNCTPNLMQGMYNQGNNQGGYDKTVKD